MININKKTLISILTLGVIISAGYFGSSNILAQEEVYGHNKLITAIAQKFNLNEADVEAVFSSVHDEQIEQMRMEKENRLTQAVNDGVITEDQKLAILSKFTDISQQKLHGREEMAKWFSDSGIDSEKLRPYLGKTKFRYFR